ncbi:HD domain-containing protein [Lachnoclostridium sp. Marseille-P6806]|uniref:HD domain-containing protein n=1 Tax=Lachnoclostridium sp. Marseille-P6806 TaxID=2364793 RepID=UPI0010300AD8|nr:HD domain-containing protein [Lachnoclostridium sp. Marseille-P6806]
MDYRELMQDPEILAYYRKGNEILGHLGFTDHSAGHAALVAKQAAQLLAELGYPEHEMELARIAGFLHDIGNAVNRSHHAEYGALLVNDILRKYDMPLEDRVTVVAAIANHDESTGTASDPVSAALIIADKTDVRRNRVRTKDPVQFDIHDRVNYAVTGQNLLYDKEKNTITLNLQIDESICTMYDYFEIFLNRMVMCRRAAEVLGVTFRLKANGQKVL